MKLDDLLAECRALDIRFWVENGKLRYDAPMGVMTAERRSLLAANRDALISRLDNAPIGDFPAMTIAVSANREDLPLSFGQERIWFVEQLNPGIPWFHIPLILHFSGILDPLALEQSLNLMLMRHETLRTTYAEKDGRVLQSIMSAPPPLILNLIPIKADRSKPTQDEILDILTTACQAPFDLTRDLPLRAQLYRVDSASHYLLLTLHHIATDGWSNYLLVDELLSAYASLGKKQPCRFPDFRIQYRDFAIWQRNQLDQTAIEMAISHWKKQVGDDLSGTELPADYPRPVNPTFRSGRLELSIPPDTVERLHRFCSAHKTTPYLTLLSVFNVLLWRYSAKDTITVATPIAGRYHHDIEPLVGFFVNSLVLRCTLAENPPFVDLLDQVRDLAGSAMKHEHVPFEKIFAALKPVRDPRRNPLAEIVFAFHDRPKFQWQLPDVTVQSPLCHAGYSRSDLELHLIKSKDSLHGLWVYSQDIFTQTTVERIHGHFLQLIAGTLTAPRQRLAEIPMLTTRERQHLLGAWNNTARTIPEIGVHRWFEEQAAKTPNHPAIIAGQRQLTYAELNKAANQLAHHLQRQGVGPDVLVGIMLPRSPEVVVAIMAILKAGGAYLVLDASYPPERLTFMLADAGPALVITRENLLNFISTSTVKTLCLDRDQGKIGAEATTNPVSTVNLTHLAYTVYTSGSTGQPKGILITHRGLVNFSLAVIEKYGISAADRRLQFVSMSADVLIGDLFPYLIAGGTVVLRPDGDILTIREFLGFLEAQHITVVGLPSSYWHEWVTQMEQDDWLIPGSLRLVIVGMEKVKADRLAIWKDKAKDRLRWCNAYGPSETTGTATIYEADMSSETPLTSIPIGRPLANVQVYVLDPRLNPQPIGVPGEIYIGGHGVGRGYLNRPELTAEKFIRNPFNDNGNDYLYKTGDLGRFLDDGNLEFLGRGDHQIKIRGYRIEAEEIEQALQQHPEVQHAVVIAREDRPGDQRLVAYVVIKTEFRRLNTESDTDILTVGSHAQDIHRTSDKLLNYLKQKLPVYMVPAALLVLDSLPLTPNGKVDRQALPIPLPPTIHPGDTDNLPKTPLEKAVAAIWCEVLNLETIGIHDLFFDVGGHSLLAIQLLNKIEKLTQKRLPITFFFATPSIAGNIKYLNQSDRIDTWSPLVTINPTGVKTPLIFLHVLGGNFNYGRRIAKYLRADRPIHGLQPLGHQGEIQAFKSIGEMAAFYLEKIAILYPRQSYILACWSWGVYPAYEMACQLARQGKPPPLLVVIDTVLKSGYQRVSPLKNLICGLPRFFTGLPKWFFFELVHFSLVDIHRRGKLFAKDFIKNLQEMSGLKPTAFTTIKIEDVFALDELPEESRDIALRLWPLSRNYNPQPFPGRMVLFKSLSPGLFAAFKNQENWRDLVVGGVEIITIPGNHLTITNDPHVKDLAEKLQVCLDRVDADPFGSPFGASPDNVHDFNIL